VLNWPWFVGTFFCVGGKLFSKRFSDLGGEFRCLLLPWFLEPKKSPFDHDS